MKSWIKWGIWGAVIYFIANITIDNIYPLCDYQNFGPVCSTLETISRNAFPSWLLGQAGVFNKVQFFFAAKGIALSFRVTAILVVACIDIIIGFVIGALLAKIIPALKKKIS